MAGIVEAADAAAPASADAPAPALSELEQQFQAKSDFVHQWTTGKKATTEEKLNAYKFFKQGTVGDVNIERPSMFNFEGKSKWDAWNSIKGMVKDDAMKNYIEEIDRQHAKYGD